jgi:hypothetical protein
MKIPQGNYKMNKKVALAILTATALTACSDAKEDSFIAKCVADGDSESACACAYDIASADLGGQQLDLFVAMATNDEALHAAVSKELGTFSMIGATAKIGVVLGKVASQCDVQL